MTPGTLAATTHRAQHAAQGAVCDAERSSTPVSATQQREPPGLGSAMLPKLPTDGSWDFEGASPVMVDRRGLAALRRVLGALPAACAAHLKRRGQRAGGYCCDNATAGDGRLCAGQNTEYGPDDCRKDSERARASAARTTQIAYSTDKGSLLRLRGRCPPVRAVASQMP